MKDQILKIAKVKSEKEFYKKYPTEEAFMKVHGKQLKKAAMGTAMVKQQLEQLTDFGNPPIAQYGTSFKPLSYEDALTGSRAMNTGRTKEQYVADRTLGKVEDEPTPTEPDGIGNLVSMGMDVASQFMGDGEDEGGTDEMRDGGYVAIPKAQWGQIAGVLKGVGQKSGGIGNLLGDVIGGKGTSKGIMGAMGPKGLLGKGGPGLKSLATKGGLGAAGKAAGLGILNAAPEILGGIGQMKEQKNQIAKAETAANVSGLVNQATRSNPVEIQQGNYVRPEDNLVQPGQLGVPQGVGTNFLAQDGATVGGNKTEIQNMYTPGTLYDDLGYEPLDDSNIKQYQSGGKKLLSSENINIDSYGNRGVLNRQIFENSNMSRDTSYTYSTPKSLIKYETNSGKPIAATFSPDRKEMFNSTQSDSLSKYKQLLSDPFDKDIEKSYSATRKLGSGKFKNGGDIPEAAFGDYFQSSGQASIGKGVGSAIGSVFGGPLGGMIGGALGTVAGNLFGGARDARRLRGFQEQTKKNTMESAGAQMASGIRGTFGNFMEDGGWVSNDWQPQVITKFGEYNVKDLLKPDPMMNTLRSGGHIAQVDYTAPSMRALETAQNGKRMAMGGDLKIHWGGDAEVLSNNDYVGEIVQFKGKDHEESAGNGKTGIGITYGDQPVEVEGGGDGNHHNGEIGVQLQDGGNKEGLTIYGNVKINKELAEILGDKSAVGKKFKGQAKDIAKNDAKQSKIIDNAMELASTVDKNNKYDQLKLNSVIAMEQGAKKQKKINARKLENLAIVQDSLLEVADTKGVDPNELFTAKFGKTIKKAQNGDTTVGFSDPITHEFITDMGYRTLPDVVVKSSKKNKLDASPILTERNVSLGDSLGQYLKGLDKTPNIAPKKKGKFDWELATQALIASVPFGRPTNQSPMDPSQTYPEMLALATNQLEPVQAQQFTPLLQGAPADISLQDQLNEITAQSRVAERMMQNNPEAAAALFADVANAKTKVLGEQFRMNQARREQVYAENRQALNQAQLQNLQILDKQYERQSIAKSKTKQQALEAAKSIVAKQIQDRALNRKLSILENTYGYRFSPEGLAFSINNPAQFNMYGSGKSSGTGGLAEGLEFVYDANQNIIGTRKKSSKAGSSVSDALSMLDDEDAKNGKKIKGKNKNSSIVKAFKNF
jgi:hypothetical protein